MHEPRARLGVAEATADMLVKGTKKRDAVALAKAIDFVGGTIAADATFEATLRVVQRARAQPADVPRARARDDHAVDVPRRRARQGQASRWSARVRQRLDDAGTLASAHVQNLLWGNDHVRGWINSEASIDALRRDDLVAWHKTWFVPNNAMLVVAGDVDAQEAQGRPRARVRRLEEGHGAAGADVQGAGPVGQPHPARRQAGPDADAHPHRAVRHQARRSAVLRHARVELRARRRRVQLAAHEGRARRRRQDLRRELELRSQPRQGLVRRVDVHAQQPRRSRRRSSCSARSRRWQKDGPTQAEVDAAIANIAGGYGMRFQSAADVGAALHRRRAPRLRQRVPRRTIRSRSARSTSRRRSARPARSSIRRTYVVVMVGDAKDLEPQLKKAGWRYEKVAFAEPITPEVAAARRAGRSRRRSPRRSQLAHEALAAKGGKAKLAAIKSLQHDRDRHDDDPGPEAAGRDRARVRRARQDADRRDAREAVQGRSSASTARPAGSWRRRSTGSRADRRVQGQRRRAGAVRSAGASPS